MESTRVLVDIECRLFHGFFGLNREASAEMSITQMIEERVKPLAGTVDFARFPNVSVSTIEGDQVTRVFNLSRTLGSLGTIGADLRLRVQLLPQ